LSRKQIAAFDFDGVINPYTKGYNFGHLSEDPVEGIKEEIARIILEYRVVIFSSRCEKPEGIIKIQNYLDKHGIIVDKIQATKPKAYVIIDDKAICFDGKSEGLLEKIQAFVPWHKK